MPCRLCCPRSPGAPESTPKGSEDLPPVGQLVFGMTHGEQRLLCSKNMELQKPVEIRVAFPSEDLQHLYSVNMKC